MIMKDHWRHTLAVIAVYGLFLAVQSQSSGSGSGSGAGGPSQVLQITQDPYNVTVPVGGVAMFSCSIEIINIDTNDDDFVIDWFADGAFVNDTQESRVMITEVLIDSNTVRSNLSIADLELSDDDSFYSCGAVFGDTMVYSLEAILRIQYPASITIAPQSLVVNQSDDAIFTCTGFGIPVPSLKWLNGSMEIDAESIERISISEFNQVNDSGFTVAMSVLTIGSVIKADENTTFTCIGNNSVPDFINTDDTDYVTFTVQVPPMVTVIGDDNKLNLVGDRTTLEFQISEASPEVLVDDINLFFNNGVDVTEITAVFSSNTVRYDIIGIENGDEGNYTLVANNPAGSSEATVVLEVQAGPIILDQPVSQNIIEGSSVIFNCTSSSEPLHSISWTFNDELIASYDADTNMLFLFNSDKYSILDSSFVSYGQLTIDNVTFNDSGIYACNVSNIHESQQAYAQLTVQVPPNAIISTTMVTGVVGYAVSFSCVVKANPLPTIIWLVNGTILDISSEGSLFQEQIDAITVNSTVTLSNLNLNDIGQYSCNASNFLVEMKSDVSDELFLEVLHPVNITALEPTEVIINQTRQASFICQGYGIPLPNITWIKATDGNVVENITGITQIHEFLIPPTTLESVLTFVQGMNSDESTYKCQASNDVPNFIGSPEVDEVTLLVQVPVEIVDDPIDTVHFAGGSISLSCNASGVPIPTFSWYKDNNEYLSDSHPRIEITNRTIIDQVNEGLAESTITFFDLQLSDDADYHCQATNPGAHDTVFVVYSNQAHLTVEYPPNVTTLEPLEIIINQTQEAVFSCEAYGIPVPSISWIKVSDDAIVDNNTGLTEITESVVTTNTLQSVLRFVSGMNSNESIYTCKGMNGINNVINSPEEDNVTLLVQVPVEIVDDPIDTVHFAGGSISLSCNASGVPIPTFSWYKDNNEYLSDSHPRIEITNKTIIDQVNEGLAESTITFFDLQLSDDADYHCRATNPGAHDTVFIVYSNQAHLLIEHPPNVTVEPQLTVINESTVSFIELECYSFGIPPPTLTWTKIRTGEVLISESLIQVSESVTHSSSMSVLRIYSPRDPDESNYTCKAVNNITNVLGTPESGTVELYVQDPAKVVRSPEGVTLPAGFPQYKMFCSAEGIPVPTITWLKDNVPLVDSGDSEDVRRLFIDPGVPFVFPTESAPEFGIIHSTLTLAELMLSDDAEYTCMAENNGAPGNVFKVYSDSVSINIEHPPLVSVEPVNLVINQTATVIFTCTIFGIPTPSFTWSKNPDPTPLVNITGILEISSFTEGNNITTVLTIFSTARTDMGEYKCSAINNIENLIVSPESSTATLFVQEPSLIIQNPTNVTNYINGSAEFTCQASGIPVPNIMWFRNDTLIGTGGRLTISETTLISPNEHNITSVLFINELQLSDTAFYHCVTDNPGAMDQVNFIAVSEVAFLKVQNPPSVFVSPLLTIINETNSTKFTCQVFGIPVPVVSWIRHREGFESEIIDGLGDPTITVSVSGYTVTSVLKFIEPLMNQEAIYECMGENNVTNVIGAAETVNVSLFVQAPAQFTLHPQSQTNFTAGSISLSCIAVGLPPPTITWMKNEVEFTETDRITIESSESFNDVSGETNSSVLIENIVLEDAGSYYCVANNTGANGTTFRAFSRRITVTVLYPPSLSVVPVSKTVNQTDVVPLTCTVFALPRPEITWTDNREDIVINPLEGFISIKENSLDNNTYTSVLTFLSIVKANESNYTCTAVNNVTNAIGAIDTAGSSLIVQVPATVTSVVGPVLDSRQGGTVVFQFILTNDSPPVLTENIRWYFRGVDVLEDITDTQDVRFNISSDRLRLEITGVTAAQEGAYILEALNEAGIGSGTIIFNIEGPPSIIIGPKDKIRREGDQVVFPCFATGDPEPTISWTFNNTEIQTDTKYNIAPITEGEDFGSLTVYDITYYDKGEYTCTVINVNGTSSDSAMLQVQVVPVITVHPLTQPGIAGGNVTLTCTAIGFPLTIIQPLNEEIGAIVWLKNNVLVTSELIPLSTIQRVPGNTLDITVFTSLTITDLQLRDVANYSCNASNDLFEPRFDVSNDAELTVLYPPNVAVSPKSFVVNQSQFINFTCTVFGIPIPILTWYDTSNLTDPLIATDETFFVERIYTNGSDLLLVESILVFSNALRTDMSSYTCVAVNDIPNILGTPESGEIVLHVQVPAEITASPVTNIEHFRGGVTNISCSAFGLPLPTVTWYRNDEVLQLTNRVYVVEDISISDTEGNITSTLVFGVVELVDNASYYCVANNTGAPGNEFVMQSDSSFLFVTHPPDVLLTPSTQLTVNVTFEATLVCFVFAIPLPKITWIRNSDKSIVEEQPGRVSITQEDNIHNRTSTLFFSETLKTDESFYTCVAVNNITNVIDTPENATVDLIVQVPANVTAVTDSPIIGVDTESVVLQFVITQDDPLIQVNNIRWEFLTSDGLVEDITTSSITDPHYELSADRLSLTIVQLNFAHQGRYILFATNEAGTRSNSIDLFIQRQPILLILPQPQTKLEGDSVTFMCLASANPIPNVTWTFQDQPITNRGRFSIGTSGVLFGALTIGNITFTDQGSYKCRFDNPHGSVEANTQLTVQVSPVFQDITVPVNGTAGSSVSMTCNSTGVPVPSITWLKDGNPMSSTPGQSDISFDSFLLSSGIHSITSTLQLMGLVLNDTSNYSCTADNVLARPQNELSDELPLLVLYPPDVSINRDSLTVNQSDLSSFTCEAFGIPLPSFTWFFNGSSISTNNGYVISNSARINGSGLEIQVSTLTILNSIRSIHEGSYTCRASNDIDNLIGTPESVDALLTVQVPPRVQAITEDPVGVVNRTVTLSFLIDQASPVVQVHNIEWRFDDTTLLNNGVQALLANHMFSADVLSLTLTNIQHSDQGVYSVTATNEAGFNSSEIFLEVEAAPVITVSPTDTMQLEGLNVTFECEAVAEPLYTVEWQLNETSLNNSSNKYLVNPITGQLSIYSVVLEDTGMYTCIVDNIHGNDSASATLTIQSVPEFTVNPVGVSVLLIGETVQLNCSSFAVPVSNIIWLKDESVLDLSDQSITVIASVQEQVTFSELTISNLGFINTGSYSCMAVNELVSKQYSNSTLSQIIVNMPIVIVESPKDSIVNETDVAEYKCIAEGLPTPSITWSTPDVSDLTSVDFVRVEQSITESMGASRVESTLTFPRIQDTEANTYTCTASNIPRDTTVAVNESFNIIVQTKPVVVFTGNGTVVGVEFREAEMRFNVSRDLPLVLVDDIRWFFKQQGFNTRREIIDDDRYTFSEDRLTLTVRFLNLTDSGTYTVEASNIVGTGSASASLDVQKAPVIIVPLVSLRHLSGTTAAFICEADANPRHTIEWTKNDEQIFNSSRILITGLGTAISTLTITDLQLNDTGSYTCFAENVHGNDSTTNELFVQVPPSFIDNPTSVNLTAGSSVTVLCNVTGFPQPEVDILKDGVTDSSLSYERSNGSLPNGLLFQSVSLLLSDVTFADTALYSCSASNKLASQVTNMSPAALHTVQYAPDVSVSPLSIVANESDSIVLVCQVSALPVPNIVWLNSSSDVSLSAPTESGSVTVTLNQSPSDIPVIVSNLSISGILKIHEANYTCVASNGIENLLGTPENAIVPVIVQVPPTVIAVDSSVLGVVNGSVTLMFIIERASPEVLVDSIRWSFVGSESVTSEDITTPSDSRLIVSMNRLTLTIYNITNEDEGNYTLTASNPAGISTDTITFSVEAAPVFDIVPENLNVLSGRPAVFACNATSEPLYSIRWEREGLVIAQYLSPQDVPDSVNAFARLNSTETGVATVIDDSKYLLEGEGSLYGQLMVLDTVLDDAREYTCYISNVHGNISTSATLLVQVVPVFTSGFRSQTNASVSENVTVNCNAAGQPEPNITWYRDGVELTSEDEGVRIVETAGVREFNSSLRLMSVTRAHQGEYWCNATNFLFERFEATSPRWIFNVYYPPNVIKVPITLQRQAAQYAVFKCQITSFPAPVVQWTRTGSVDPITDRRGKFEIKTTLDDSSITGPYSVETQLVIFNLSFTDQQTYTCAGISQVNVQNFINARSNASASLFVNVPPRVVAITASPSIAEWSNPFTISFDVLNAQPQVTPQNITWRFDPSTNTGLEQIVASDRLVFSSNRRSLEITSVRLSDIGRYILTAINTGGSSTASIAINVLVAPVIENGINASLSVPVDIGNTISFTCRADGIPTPTLIWRRNGTVIATTGRTTVSLVTGPSIRTEIPTMESVISTVTLRDVKESDDYTRWTCTAENSVGINEHYYILRVEENGDPCVPNPCQNGGNCYTQDGFVCVCIDGYTGERCDLRANPNGIIRPRITVPPRPISSQLHSIVNLTCIAEGNPQPNIEWYKDDVVIRDAKAFLYTFELGVNSRGWYTCRAVSNLEGGRSEQAISDPVLVTIDNVAQYLMTSTVSISLLQNIYGSNLNNEQLVNRYIELLGSDFTGEILRNGSVIFSVSLHALIDQKDTYNSTFSAIVTLVTDAPNLQELYSFLLSYEGTPSFVLHDLIRFDGCVSEVSSFSPSVYWPETNLGINSTLECPCGDISLGVGQPRASRRCGGTFATGAEWREPLDSSCVFNSGAQSLCLISSVSDLDAVLFEVAAQSGDISSGTELLISISLLENRLQELMSNLLLLPQFLSVINDIVTVDREILLDAQETGNTSSRILTMLDEVGNAIPTVSGTMVYNQSSFVLSVYNTTNDQIQFNTKYGAFPVNVNTSVGLPSSGSAKYITTVYPDDRLFATAKMFTLGSVVIGIDSNTNGNRSAMMRFGVNQTLVSQDTEPVCVFWDFELAGGRGDWSTLGCERLTSLKEDDNLVTCFCNHFTHFAVVFRPVDSIAAEQTKDSAELFLTGMEAITVIIFVISIVFLVITIVLYLKAWTALDRANAILFINTCSAMIVLYVIYIGAIYAKSNEHTCIVFAALFHYIFLVVVFALMLESGFFFIRRFWEKIERYSSAIAITTWIVPALIVIFCVAPGHDLYSTDNVCRPRGTPFYLGMVIPFIAAMLLSWTLLGIWLLKSRAANMLQWSQIVVVSILFSVGWTFALAVGEVVPLSAATLQILFCMTGGLLGLYIFVLYCIGVPTIRGLLCRKKKEDASDVFTRATSNAQSSMRLVKTMTLSTSTHDSEPPPSGSPMMDEVIVGVVDVNDVADSKETDF